MTLNVGSARVVTLLCLITSIVACDTSQEAGLTEPTEQNEVSKPPETEPSETSATPSTAAAVITETTVPEPTTPPIDLQAVMNELDTVHELINSECSNEGGETNYGKGPSFLAECEFGGLQKCVSSKMSRRPSPIRRSISTLNEPNSTFGSDRLSISAAQATWLSKAVLSAALPSLDLLTFPRQDTEAPPTKS